MSSLLWGDLELTWQYPLNEFHSEQARVQLRKLIQHSLWPSMQARMVTSSLAQFAILCASYLLRSRPAISIVWTLVVWCGLSTSIVAFQCLRHFCAKYSPRPYTSRRILGPDYLPPLLIAFCVAFGSPQMTSEAVLEYRATYMYMRQHCSQPSQCLVHGALLRVWVYVVLPSRPTSAKKGKGLQEREGSVELCIQAVSHQNAIGYTLEISVVKCTCSPRSIVEMFL